MANVLGALSFLDTPDVNSALVLTTLTGVTSVLGTTNQIDISGSVPTFTAALANNPVIPGVGSLTLPSGTIAQRPASPVAGMIRFNTTNNYIEYFNGTTWIAKGNILQTITGTISPLSSNSQIPYDNTIPQITEGVQIWTRSFTPILSNSTIVITTNTFFTVNSSSSAYITVATFNGNTNAMHAQLAANTRGSGEGYMVMATATETSGSTTARTYSCRMGPNINLTMYVAQGTGGQAYGGVSGGTFIIQEIAP